GDQLPAVHDGLRSLPELGAGLHGGAQHVPRGDMGYVVAHRQAVSLGALAGPLPAEQDDSDSVGQRSAPFGLLEEALVVAHHELAVDLLHGLERHADGDEDRDAEEAELLAAASITERLAGD